jgi:hypothetical protein
MRNKDSYQENMRVHENSENIGGIFSIKLKKIKA